MDVIWAGVGAGVGEGRGWGGVGVTPHTIWGGGGERETRDHICFYIHVSIHVWIDDCITVYTNIQSCKYVCTVYTVYIHIHMLAPPQNRRFSLACFEG